MDEIGLQVLTRAHRLLLCSRCRSLFTLCRLCARGRRYCTEACAAEARRRSVREAGSRYQRTQEGAHRNAIRPRDSRARRRQAVTHQSRYRAAPGRLLGHAAVAGSPHAQALQDPSPTSKGPRLAQSNTEGFPHTPAVRCPSCDRSCSSLALVTPVGPRKTRHRRWRVSSPDLRAS